jgi:hypothetical protein
MISVILILLISISFSALVEVEFIDPDLLGFYQTAHLYNLYKDQDILYLEHADSGVIREITQVQNCKSGPGTEHYFGDNREDPSYVGCRFVYGNRRYVQKAELFSYLRRNIDGDINKYLLGDYKTITITKDKEEIEVIDWSTVNKEIATMMRRAIAQPYQDCCTKANERNFAVIKDLFDVSRLLGPANGEFVYMRVKDLVNFQRKILRVRSDSVRVKGDIYG